MADKDAEIILSKVMGTMEGASIQQLILYIPHTDKKGKSSLNLTAGFTELGNLIQSKIQERSL